MYEALITTINGALDHARKVKSKLEFWRRVLEMRSRSSSHEVLMGPATDILNADEQLKIKLGDIECYLKSGRTD